MSGQPEQFDGHLISETVEPSPESREQCKAEMLGALIASSSGSDFKRVVNIEKARTLQEKSKFTVEESVEIIEKAVNTIKLDMSRKTVMHAKAWIKWFILGVNEVFELPKETIQELSFVASSYAVESHLDGEKTAINFVEEDDIFHFGTNEELSEEEFKERGKKVFIDKYVLETVCELLESEGKDLFLRTVDDFDISAEMLQSKLSEYLSNEKGSEYSNPDMAIKLKNAFNFQDNFLSSEKFQRALKEALTNSFLNWSNPAQGKKLIEEFNLTKEGFDEIAPYIIANLLIEEFLDEAVQFISDYNIPKKAVEDAIVQQKAIHYHLALGDSEFIVQIIERLQISDTVLSEIDDIFVDLWDEDDDSYLIKEIKLLNSDKNFSQLFPKSIEKIKERLLVKLPQDEDLADYFLENLENYYQEPWVKEYLSKAISHFSVAKKFHNNCHTHDGKWAYVDFPNIKKQPWFEDIDNQAEMILGNLNQYEDGEEEDENNVGSFSEYDPYENDPNLFTREQAHLAVALTELLRGNTDKNALETSDHNPKKQEKLLELMSNFGPEIKKALLEIDQEIKNAFADFLKKIKQNDRIDDQEKEAMINPEKSQVKMIPLMDNIRSFVARYLIQITRGDYERLSNAIEPLTQNLKTIIKNGLDLYLQILLVDVPLYDKLYEEFDTWRESGRYPLEVYLGRDGVYAYIGRRAQDAARRRKLGTKKRSLLREAGEVLEIKPKYLVYPRYFRDNLNYETKREFLEQERISKESDPLFYDTGYTGTIPEQIMEIMDFEPDEIEQRIRLLSAQSAHRRVKGISENARSEIVEYIEHNAKTEESAEGLIIDEKTGKIRHIAKPTTPEEQFNFTMIKQAISRHYWFKEMLYHEPTGNVNLDSENYTLRIRKEYVDQLPEEFIKNAKEYLSAHGDVLKSSKGEGEYPDEEIILFKLKDETEIIAKKIELRKAKETRKEFAILISAKKHNLKTAEPIGFLAGKTEGDGSYLLMGKLEGVSGRIFEKKLMESGKYTEDQIKSIMQSVVEKNKEMAELFKEKLNIDKRWRIKDTLIQFNEVTGEVEEVIPIDWERVHTFDPDKPEKIDEIN